MIDYKVGDWVERTGDDNLEEGMKRGNTYKVDRIHGINLYLVGRKRDNLCWDVVLFKKYDKKAIVLNIIKDL